MVVGAAAVDERIADIGTDFLREVAQHLGPRNAAVIAEIDEEWQTPLDARMEALGGVVFRRTRLDIGDAYVERTIAADKAELAALKAEQTQAATETKAKLQAKIDAARRKLQGKHDQVKERVEAVKREADDKIASMNEQAAKVKGESKVQRQKRLAEVRADYQTRVTKLHQAWEQMKSALAS
jgi:hypothetical protein